MNLWVLLNVTVNLLNIAPNELKRVVCVKGGEVNILPNLKDLKKLDFNEIYALCYSLYLLWS